MTEPARCEIEQELRFAVVMYGGVSLAIYINGVAQELFRLVQATAPAADGASARHADDELDGSARVYRELGRRLSLRGLEPDRAAAGGGAASRPIRTRFVVDVLSGTSAGGINGILLAKALANGSDFGVSRRLWIDVADLGVLLARGRRRRRSLLGGDRLYGEARAILARLGGAEATAPAAGDAPSDASAAAAGRAPYVEQLDLAVTATDLAGLPTALALRYGDGSAVPEPEHRTVFELSSGTRATSGADHSDFTAAHDRLLAFAARATSAFPFAFEPVALGALPDAPGDVPAAQDGLRARLFAAHLRRGVEPEQVWFADGGYLDNKPFSHATRALRRRRADVPVSRRLLYVEPDPAATVEPRDRYDGRQPNVFENVLAATVGLRGFEPIRQDVADIAERNGRVARLRAIEQDAAEAIGALDPGATGPAGQPGYAAYRSLRLRATLDRIGEVAAALGGWESDDDRGRAVREALRGWASAATADAERDLLDTLDAAFVHRCSSFLHDRVNELLRGNRPPQQERFAARLQIALPPVCDGTALRALKRGLNDALAPLRAVEWTLERAVADPVPDATIGAATAGGASPAVAQEPLATARAAALRLGRTPAGEGPQAAGAFVKALAAVVGPPLLAASAALPEAIEQAPVDEQTRALLHACHDRFELFDAIVLPLAHPSLGEVNVTEVWRVSPLDATGIDVPPQQRLAGTRLHHFGGFLDAGWRRNDLLWGRLDGAEAILDAVLAGEEHAAARDRLRVAAQAAILREELGAEGEDEEVVADFARRFSAPPQLGLAARVRLVARLAPRLAPRVLLTLVRGIGRGEPLRPSR